MENITTQDQEINEEIFGIPVFKIRFPFWGNLMEMVNEPVPATQEK